MFSRHELEALLDQRVLLFDGAVGTELYNQGHSFDGSLDALCIRSPLAVRRVHRDYVAAGARVLTTNTFGANRIRLAPQGLAEQVAAINRAGVEIARDAAADRPPHNRPAVAGAIGPLGQPIAPVGKLSRAEAEVAFREQAEALVAADPDFIVFETFGNLDELVLATRALRAVRSDAGFIAYATFTDDGKTLFGHKPEEVVRVMLAEGAAAVGANCSVGPQGMDEVFERMARVNDARLAFSPNAGMPQVVDGRFVYVNSPDYFAEWAKSVVERGARVVGGCCGTTPRHIELAVAEIGVRAPQPIRGAQARAISVALADASYDAEPAPAASAAAHASDFERKLAAGEFVVSVELDPPRGVDGERLVRGAIACKQAGADAINIADSPLATARMSPLALGVLIQQQVAIELILHVSCRDRNVLGLLSETMGAHALGIRHTLCVTGDPPSVGDYPGTHAVFEVDSIGLLRMLDGLNHGRNPNGKELRYNTDFRLSCAVNPTAENLDREIARFHEKQDAGAAYALTQPIYSLDVLERFVERAKPQIPLLVGILPLRNARHAHFIHHEVPGMAIPQEIRDRMAAAGEAGPEEGIRIAREFLAQIRKVCAGTYLMPPFNKFEMAVDILADDEA